MNVLRASLLPALPLFMVACIAGGVAPSDEDVGPSNAASPVRTIAEPSRSHAASEAASTEAASAEPVSAGCGPSGVPVLGDDDFTPFSHQLSAPDPTEYPAIFGSGIAVAGPAQAAEMFPGFLAPPARMGQATIQLILVEDVERGAGPGARVFYGTAPVGPGESLPFFVRRGGSVVRQESTKGQDARVVKETLGDRAVIVVVGRFEAALVHADPSEPSDFRPYHLYWSDDDRDWTIIAGVTDPRTLIDFARQIYCDT